MPSGLSGLVLDHTAVLALAHDNPDMVHVVDQAYRTATSLLVPTTSLATALLDVQEIHELNNILTMLDRITVLYDELSTRRAYNIHVRMYGEDVVKPEHRLSFGHAAVCATERNWPVLTADDASWGFAGREVSLLIVEI
ncbi:PIN domain-containing protein [Microtetraspora malaysiensis]|uniref:PIN domain-containing protein n=1 Tax=Microtetraspora malaysiensis TaxID=161358 RepID=A0ABW6SZP8_9ACTN